MNITFLIGNGFDIGMGLKSRYSDYFGFCKKEAEKNKKTISPLLSEIFKDVEKWADFEKKYGEYAKDFTVDDKIEYVDQLAEFEDDFLNYLKNEEKQLLYDQAKINEQFVNAFKTYFGTLKTKSKNAINKIYESHNHEGHIFNFISFNYTYVLEKCLDCIPQRKINERKIANTYIDKVGHIVHVHGDENNFPIIGVNDVSQIKNEQLAKDPYVVKRIVKPTVNSANRTDYDDIATNLISQSHIICIYGMSLGETDKKWWQLIVNWLKSDNKQLIIFDYDENYRQSTQVDWLNKEDSIIEKLQGYIQKDKIDLETLRPRIHIAVNKNIFALNLRKADNNEETTEPSETDKRDAV